MVPQTGEEARLKVPGCRDVPRVGASPHHKSQRAAGNSAPCILLPCSNCSGLCQEWGSVAQLETIVSRKSIIIRTPPPTALLNEPAGRAGTVYPRPRAADARDAGHRRWGQRCAAAEQCRGPAEKSTINLNRPCRERCWDGSARRGPQNGRPPVLVIGLMICFCRLYAMAIL